MFSSKFVREKREKSRKSQNPCSAEKSWERKKEEGERERRKRERERHNNERVRVHIKHFKKERENTLSTEFERQKREIVRFPV